MSNTISEAVLALPSEQDVSASLTAVGMGEMGAAMDLLASCFGRSHQLRADGSCRCGLHTPTAYVRKVV